MTSPPLRPLAPAEPSSELRASAKSDCEAAEALSQLHTQQAAEQVPPTASSAEKVTPIVSPAEDTPLSSVPPSHSGSPHGSFSVNSLLNSPALPAPGGYPFLRAPPGSLRDPSTTGRRELPSRSAKRTASLTELRSPKSRRDNQGSPQQSNLPASSTGAQLTPAPFHQAPTRAPSRVRAPASVGPRTPTQTCEPKAGRRPAGRPRRNPPHPADHGSSTGARVDDHEDVAMMSQRPHTAASVDFQAPLRFHNTFKESGPKQRRPARSTASSGYRPSPSLSRHEPQGSPYSAGPHSSYPHPPPGPFTPQSVPAHFSPSSSSTLHTLGSPTQPAQSPSSSGPPYGTPGVPILPPPYQTFPTMNSPALQAPDHNSQVEADGYMIIRDAVSTHLVRDVVAVIGKGLPVNERLETVQIYATPVQAYVLRDEFVSRWRLALSPFYDPMDRSIPKMPSTNTIGSFKESDPTALMKSLLHVPGRDNIFVHIALSDLSPENGFFTILKGSHRTNHPGMTPVKNWIKAPINLREGDALVWRGDMSYMLSSNGGGQWQSMTFDWGPGLIDLTDE